MGISLPIGSHLDESQARRTTRQAEDYFSTAGQRAGDEFSRQVNHGLGKVDTSRSRAQAAALERAFDRAADAAGKLRTEEAKLEAVRASGTATDAQLIAHSERAERARRAEARAVREATNAVRDLQNAGRSSGGFMDNMGRSMDSLGTAARSFAIAGAPAAILAVGGAAITASGALAVLPAALSGVAAGVGTLVLGMQGFGDAIKDMGDSKKFAEDLQKLSPAAQQTALEFKNLVDGPLGELRKATQESLFSGMAKEFHDAANVMLPSVKAATTGIASAFNGMAHGSLDQLMKPETAGAFDATLRNITQAFTNLAPAAAPFTKAMTDIAQVGSSFLPNMSTAITNAATAFSQFISHAAETGQLANWIREGGDMLKQIGTLAWEFGRAIAALMPTAKTVFGYVSGALHETADLIREHPGLIWGVVGAFAAWKTIEGTAALITSLTTISTALRALPAVAATAGAGISAGLAGAAATISRITAGLGAAATVAARGGMPAFVPLPEDMTKSRSPQDVQAMIDDLTGKKPQSPGTPGVPGMSRGALDAIHGTDGSMPGSSWFGNLTPPAAPGLGNVTAGLAPWTPAAVPAVPADGGSGSKARQLPTVAAAGTDPMSLLQGFAPTASLYSAAGSVLDQQQKVAQATSDLNELMKSGTATQSEIIAKKNELQRAEREQHEAELRLMEAKQQATNKSLKSMQSTHDAMSTLGAGLDQDLGISKGLPGLADNLVRFVGHLAAAPLMAQLEAITKANPSQGGYGLMGTLAAQGVFGPDYTGVGPTAGPSTYPTTYPGMAPGYGSQPYGLPAGTNTGGYGSSGAVFPQWVHALEQAFGVKASTYAGHQESDRNEPGYAPNPMHLNRGIDWTGSADAMQRFANYMAGQPNAEQVIYQNPLTGQATESVAGQARPGYFASDLGAHQNHVHTRQAQSIPTPTMDPYGVVNAGPMYPGTGYPNALPGTQPLGTVGPAASVFAGAQNPTQIGATVGPPNGTGQGGINIDGSGLISAGMAAGGMALDMLAPGAGQAAQTGFKLLDRGIKYLGQDAGIGMQGLLETFLPTGGSQLAQNNWFTKIAGGLAGALPAIPNIAGKQVPQQQRGGQGGNTTNNTSTTNINVDATGRDDGQGIARDIAAHQAAAAMTPAVGP